MKIWKKTAILALTAIMLFGIAGCTSDAPAPELGKDSLMTTTVELKPLYGDQGDFLAYNPDRGWRLEAFINVANSTGDGMGTQPEPEKVVTQALDRYQKYHPQLCQV